MVVGGALRSGAERGEVATLVEAFDFSEGEDAIGTG